MSSTKKVFLATGSGSPRVGRVLSEHFARLGYAIALHYRTSENEAFAARDNFRAQGATCEAFQADVANETEADALIESAVRCFGRIDVAVTTASIWSPKPLFDLS